MQRDTSANQSSLLFKTEQSLNREGSRMHTECQPVLDGSGVQGWPLLLTLCVTLCTSLWATSPALWSLLERSQPSYRSPQGFHHALKKPSLSPSGSCLPLASAPGNPRGTSPSQDREFDGCWPWSYLKQIKPNLLADALYNFTPN